MELATPLGQKHSEEAGTAVRLAVAAALNAPIAAKRDTTRVVFARRRRRRPLPVARESSARRVAHRYPENFILNYKRVMILQLQCMTQA